MKTVNFFKRVANATVVATIAVAVAFTSCGKKDKDDDSNGGGAPKKGDVFVAGYESVTVDGISKYVPKLWKNGVEQKITVEDNITAYINSVFVSGDTVYLAGRTAVLSAGSYGTIRAVLWKNGVMKELPGSEFYSQAKSVFVSGKDVYVCGIDENTKGRAVLWKNGKLQQLYSNTNSTNANVSSIFVSGNDVYVVGFKETDSSNPGGCVLLWKNGIMQDVIGLSTEESVSANSIFVSGSDIYVAGRYNAVAVLWKNGVMQYLPGGKSAHSVFVSGSNVYVAGYNNGGAILWKNGESQLLSGGGGSSVAYSVYVSGSNVYVAGRGDKTEGDKTVDIAILWKNGTAQELGKSDNGYEMRATSVFVTK